MTKKRRIEIRIETHEITVTKKGSASIDEYCSTCGSSVAAVPLELAARMTGGTVADLAVMLESGTVHCTEKEDTAIRICGNSLGPQGGLTGSIQIGKKK